MVLALKSLATSDIEKCSMLLFSCVAVSEEITLNLSDVVCKSCVVHRACTKASRRSRSRFLRMTATISCTRSSTLTARVGSWSKADATSPGRGGGSSSTTTVSTTLSTPLTRSPEESFHWRILRFELWQFGFRKIIFLGDFLSVYCYF